MAIIKIMVDYEAEGLWCDTEAWSRVPQDLREKLHDWNWWWEIGQRSGIPHGYREQTLDFDHDECAWIGLNLAMQVKHAMPNDSVLFFHEAEWSSPDVERYHNLSNCPGL